MPDRRNVLAAFAAGAAGAAAAPLSALGKPPATPAAEKLREKQGSCCLPSDEGYFPNVTVETHEGHRALFYNDLLRGKLVLVNFMSVAGDALYPVTENLVRVQELLGERVGRDIFMYSITVDPQGDTPRALNHFAARKGIRPGWLFLTGQPQALELIKGRFFVHRGGGGHQHQKHEHNHGHNDCSMGLVRYGNEAIGLWGSVAAKADPRQIAERVAWISPRPAVAGPPRRRGPTTIIRQPDPLPNDS